MKRIAIIYAVFMVIFAGLSYSSSNCLEIASKLWKLQNKIVEESFINLTPGAWAQYDTTKAVFLGQQKSPKTGVKLYVVEFQGKPAGQIWFRIRPKDLIYEDKTLRFWTLEPMEGFAYLSNGVYYISKQMIEFFMKGKAWSTILWEGQIFTPPNCEARVELLPTEYRVPSGKIVKATIIKSIKDGGQLYVSSEVPFGLIKSVAPSGKVNSPYLIDFGSSGGKSIMNASMLKNARPLPIFPMGPTKGKKLPFNPFK